ncbi:carbohydrate kinase [Nocardioides caricicola]|uniref:Carbohydrate kinase n=1 Tax=Nocardioides caricicola TaxID=634770 RepID=A0ABW0MUL6_9ACTN
MQSVLVIGESLIDIVHRADGRSVEYAGGSAANVAVALARLGRPVRFVTAWADDARGRVLARHLADAGVDLASDPVVLERTATAAATIGVDGSASYEFDLSWRIGEVEVAEPVVVHVCSIGAVLEPGAGQVLEVLRGLEGATVTYDINVRPAITGTGPDLVARVERMAAAADVVKASDEDLEALYPHLDPTAAARHVLTLGPSAVVVTRGGDGATWVSTEHTVEVASLPVDVADTIGAGDTFGAAVIDALWDRSPDRLTTAEIEEVLAHAARAAAVTVSRPGADPPYRSEL